MQIKNRQKCGVTGNKLHARLRSNLDSKPPLSANSSEYCVDEMGRLLSQSEGRAPEAYEIGTKDNKERGLIRFEKSKINKRLISCRE